MNFWFALIRAPYSRINTSRAPDYKSLFLPLLQKQAKGNNTKSLKTRNHESSAFESLRRKRIAKGRIKFSHDIVLFARLTTNEVRELKSPNGSNEIRILIGSRSKVRMSLALGPPLQV